MLCNGDLPGRRYRSRVRLSLNTCGNGSRECCAESSAKPRHNVRGVGSRRTREETLCRFSPGVAMVQTTQSRK